MHPMRWPWDMKRDAFQRVDAWNQGIPTMGLGNLGNDFVECGANNIHKCKNILKYLFEISNELLSLHLQIICPYFR